MFQVVSLRVAQLRHLAHSGAQRSRSGVRRLPARKIARLLGAPSASVLGLAALPAAAQPQGIAKRVQASTGTTDVAKEGFKTAEKAAEDTKDGTSLKLMVGGLWTAGNTRTVAITGSFDFRMRRASNQLSVLASANYSESALTPDDGFEKTLENYQGRVRYDRFFSEALAGYLSVSTRHDQFQDLTLRLNIDPGIAYYFIDVKETQLWGEIGYDLQHDIREDEAVSDEIAKVETRHGARLFAGYLQAFSEHVSFDTSAEYIQALDDTKNYRINWGAALTSTIAESLSIATSVNVRYDNNPLPGIKSTDVVTAFNVVYTF